MMPIVNGLAEEFRGQVDVMALNVGQAGNSRLQDAYGMRGHPSFVVLDDNNGVANRFYGPQEASTLREATAAVSPQ